MKDTHSHFDVVGGRNPKIKFGILEWSKLDDAVVPMFGFA